VISLVNHTSSFHLFFKLTNEPLKCLKANLKGISFHIEINVTMKQKEALNYKSKALTHR
jgi:hypothetical protein